MIKNLALALLMVVLAGQGDDLEQRNQDQLLLQPLQGFIGNWRGVGQKNIGILYTINCRVVKHIETSF